MARRAKCTPPLIGTEEQRKCDGPLWICAGYYADGSADYRCEKHARFGMTLNPLGPRYVPVAKTNRLMEGE